MCLNLSESLPVLHNDFTLLLPRGRCLVPDVVGEVGEAFDNVVHDRTH